MGNHTGKDGHGLTGSPLDFFHTPPTSPSEADLSTMALPSTPSSNKAQTPSPAAGTTPSSTTTSPLADWTRKLSASAEWAVINVDSAVAPETGASDEAGGSSPPPPPVERSWQERDSGVEPEAAAERAEEEMTLVLLSLMEHQRASLGLSPKADVTTGAVELLRHLISERDELLGEVDTLRETLRTERLEWRQFQCDLQVAVSVADRLRTEAEQALGLLQERHGAAQEQLALALRAQQETAGELQSLRAEHTELCSKLQDLALQQEREEVDGVGDASGGEGQAEDKDSEEREETQRDTKTEAAHMEKQQEEEEKNEAYVGDEEPEGEGHDPEEDDGSESTQLTGRGVAEGYLRSLAVLEKKKEEGRGPRDPRRIVMLSERAWSLSRLPLPADSSGASENTSTTLPLCKKTEQPSKRRRMDRALQRQDSWSSFYTGKQDEDHSSDFIKPQDGFSALLRRHGGSRRNSLLRWCQSRTQGYKHIEITNFSSSWEDGLAFCAVYHSYLPSHIPYDTLHPEDKKENLDLAFKTGENLGITATLTVEEMLKADGPDWQRVLGYVESIFRHFEM